MEQSSPIRCLGCGLCMLMWTMQVLGQPFTLLNLAHATNYPGGSARDIALLEGHAYLANLSDGIRVYDLTDPANPINVAHATNPAPPSASVQGIAAAGHYVYLANAADGLRIYDVSDPSDPVNVGHTNDSTAVRAYAGDVAVAGDYAFLANGTDGMRAYDVSSPTNPMNIWHTNAAYGNSVAATSNRVYFAGGNLSIYDSSVASQLVLLGRTTNLSSVCSDIEVVGDRAYLARTGGLLILDVSDPTNPVQLGLADNAGSPGAVAVTNNLAMTANGYNGLHVYDLSDPGAPIEVAFIDDGYFVQDVVASGNYIYTADAGLRVYLLVPTLAITGGGLGEVILSWATPPAAGFKLQHSPSLVPPDWTDETSAEVVAGNRTSVTVSTPGSTAFYRLAFEP